MSVLLKAILNAHALEHDRIRQAAWQIVSNAPLAARGLITVPTPSAACVYDAVNLVTDPEGLGALNWTSAPAGPVLMTTGGPGAWAAFMRSTAVGTTLALTQQPAAPLTAGSRFYAYWLVRATRSSGVAQVTVSAVGVTSTTTYATATLTLPGGWSLVRLTGVIGASAEAVLLRSTAIAPVAGNTLDMTGVTLCQGVDPGVTPDEFNYVYRWVGVRNGSLTRRYTTLYDALAVAEGEADIGIAALGLTTSQRQGYLTQRFQARHQPQLGDPQHDTLSGVATPAQVAVDNANGWLTGFKQQIGDVIRADGTPYDDNRTTVFVNAPARSFTVQIAYSASGPLINRLNRLILDIKPGHLNYTSVSGLTAGGFLADSGQVGVTLL
jgi:hypothetical protein